MKEDLLKYKHYLIALTALLLANFITVPLWEMQQEQSQEILLLNKHAKKIEQLIMGSSTFEEKLADAQKLQQSMAPYLFKQASEAKFKLAAQEQVESILVQSKCNLQRVNWLSSTPINQELTRWRMELRLSGNPVCMVKVTRALGSTKPTMRIQDFSFNSQVITGRSGDKINAMLTLILLHDATNFERKEGDRAKGGRDNE